MAKTLKRSPNFYVSEIAMITEEVENRQTVLFTKQNPFISNSLKKRAWEEIADKSNAPNQLKFAEEINKNHRRNVHLRDRGWN